MSIERNKADFEKELIGLKEHIDNLTTVLSVHIMSHLDSLIKEYDDHLKTNIEEISTEREQLEYRVDELETKLAEAKEGE